MLSTCHVPVDNLSLEKYLFVSFDHFQLNYLHHIHLFMFCYFQIIFPLKLLQKAESSSLR